MNSAIQKSNEIIIYLCYMDAGYIYKASLDNKAKWDIKWGTYPTLIILLASTLLFFLGSGKYLVYIGIGYSAILCIAIISYYLTQSVKEYILYNDKLVIKRKISSSDIEIILSDIQKAERFTKEDFFSSRRISNVSMFGYFGDYHHPTFGYYKIYATNLSNLILITLKNSKKIVISPDDSGVLAALNKNV